MNKFLEGDTVRLVENKGFILRKEYRMAVGKLRKGSYLYKWHFHPNGSTKHNDYEPVNEDQVIFISRDEE